MRDETCEGEGIPCILKFNIGVKLAETQNRPRKDFRYGSNPEADSQRARSTFDGRPCFEQSILGVLQQFCSFGKEPLARIRQGHLPTRAHKEGSLYLLLQSLNLLAECWLGYKQPLGRLAKVEFAGQDHKCMKL